MDARGDYSGLVSMQRVFVGRLAGCPVFDPAGDRLGKVRDVVVVYRSESAPRVIGLVLEIPGRRQVFVSIGRVTSIAQGQVITTGLINVRRFEPRADERRIMAEIVGRRVELADGSGSAVIEDAAIEPNRIGEWSIGQLYLRKPRTSASPFSKGPTVFATWGEMRERQAPGQPQSAEQLAQSYAELLPADLAGALLDLPDEADDVRLILRYGPNTAGGLMTTEPLIMPADATIAEGLARIRRHELHPALAASVYVTLPPYETPTGRYLGAVHFQRMLRYPPHERIGAILDESIEPVQAESTGAEVARRLATYDLVSMPVVDRAHRLLGSVTVDDVLDSLLPDDWRSHDEDEPIPAMETGSIRTVKP
jgi:CBS domain-containing protein/sporulation protein YlmC with PRC-barrel domain